LPTGLDGIGRRDPSLYAVGALSAGGLVTAAYLIIAHRDPAMFHRLVGSLPADALVYAHIDARADLAPFSSCPRDIRFLSDRLEPNWGSWTMVEATARLLEAALGDATVSRCTLISGQCYPILAPSAFASWELAPVDRLEIVPAPNAETHKYAWRYERRWSGSGYPHPHSPAVVVSSALNRRFGRRLDPLTPLAGRRLFAGTAWWSFTRRTAEHAAEVARNDRALTRYFSHTYCPDEAFWHTVVAEFLDSSSVGCEPTYAKWLGSAHPAPLSPEDLIREARSGRFAFARKFSSDQTDLLDLVDRLRTGKAA
jgi:hypothetical protein